MTDRQRTHHLLDARCGCRACTLAMADAVLDRVKAQGGRVPQFTEMVMLRTEIAAELASVYEVNEPELAVLRAARGYAAATHNNHKDALDDLADAAQALKEPA